jgi:uncharacterized protein YidB (DUF937 family)
MGILDQVLGQALGSISGGGKGADGAALVKGVLEMVSGHQGGIDGMHKQFQQAGLGDAMASWISTGQNKPISPADLTRVLGQGRVEELAQRAGVPKQNGADLLSQLLPAVIDQLTPKGAAPAQGQLGSLGAELLKGLAGSALRGR